MVGNTLLLTPEDLEKVARVLCLQEGSNPDNEVMVPISQLIGGGPNTGRNPRVWETKVPLIRQVVNALRVALEEQFYV